MNTNRTIRRRALQDIYGFETSFKLKKSHCRIDKLEISFDIAELENGSFSDLNEDLRHIGRTSDLLNDCGRGEKKLIFRKRRRRRSQDGFHPALIEGTIKRDTNSDIPTLRAFLKINPTRYFAYNPIERTDPHDDGFWGGEYECDDFFRLHKDQDITRVIQSESITGDNFIAFNRLREANQLNWQQYTVDYAELCAERIYSEICEHTNNERLYHFLPNLSNWTIQKIEYYYEFHTRTDDAVFITRKFGEHLKNRLKLKKDNIHSAGEEREDDNPHSYIFSTRSKSIDISLYAKAQNRIRIECRIKKNPKVCVNSIKEKNYSRTSKTALKRMLTDLKDETAKKLSPVINHKNDFRLDNILMPGELSVALGRLYIGTGSVSLYIKRIVESCMSGEKLVEPDRDNRYRRALRLLASKDLKVLKTVKKTNPREYIVKEPLLSLFRQN